MGRSNKGFTRRYWENSLEGPVDIFSRYWKAYGGIRDLARSAYLHASVAMLVVTAHFWLFEKWWEQPLSTIPSLLGFSLAGLAVFVGFSDREYQSLLATTKDENGTSVFLSTCATYIHFVVVQFLSLAFAIAAKSLDFRFDWPPLLNAYVRPAFCAFSAIGYLLFLYAIFSMVAAAMSLFRTVHWYQIYHENTGKT
jgi:hypothetical protein